MARNERTAAGPFWTRNWIEKMWRFTAENFVDFDTGSVDFDALGREEYEFRKALFYRKFKNSPRAKEAFEEAGEGYRTNVENGKKGGRPRKINGDADTREAPDESATVSDISGTPEALVNQQRGEADSLRGECHSAPPRTSGPMPQDRQVVIDFAVAEGLDVDDACECWYVTTQERDGLTADGKKINSWKAYVRKWCATRKNNRRTA